MLALIPSVNDRLSEISKKKNCILKQGPNKNLYFKPKVLIKKISF